MTTATIFNNVPVLFLYVVSLALVIWAVADVARRPSTVMPPARKALWIICSVVGWLLFGLIGAAVAVFYLVGPRRRLNAARY
jgi:uncharacterized membrane protein